MKYTEQDVERVAEAMEEASWSGAVKARMQGGNIAIAIEWADLARAALEAMEREPLEDVIHDLSPGTKIVHIWPLRKGGYEAEIGVPVTEHPDGWWDHERFMGEGANIDEAIRNAVKAAKGGE